MFDFLLEHASTTIATLALLVVAALITARWDNFTLWLLSAGHSLPVLGTIARLARRGAPRGAAGRSTATPVMTLCADYARYIRVLSRADYDNYMNYLRKAGDLGRRPFPPFLWFVIFSMVVVEAAGFAYVLAGWTLPGASEVMQQVAAAGIGFLVAVILVFFTHWAGIEIYQSNQHRRDRRAWIDAGKPGALYGPDLSLNDPQHVDDHEPAWRQRATRGHGKTTYLLTAVTLFMVISIGGGAAYVRGQVLEQELVVEAATRVRAMERFDLNLPAEVRRARVDDERALIEREVAIKRKGGWGTLVVLMIIFFFLQLLGMFFGYRYSFNGRLSRDAYRAVNADRFSSYSELVQYYDRIADIAQSKVEQLQQMIERRRAGALGGGWGTEYLTFRDYLQMREAQRRDKPLGGEAGPAATAVSSTDSAPQLPSVPEFVAVTASPPSATPVAAVVSAPDPAPVVVAPAAETAPLVEPAPAAVAVAGPAERFVEALVNPAPDASKPRTRPNTVRVSDVSPRDVLEQAEQAERQRAAERAARLRSKGSTPRKPSRVSE